MGSGPNDAELDPEAVERRSLDELFSRTYEELRRLAASVRRGEAGSTVNPTALVNEAWLKLASSPPPTPVSQLHFKRLAARAMRQVLVDAARRRNADKRGAGLAPVALDAELYPGGGGPRELLAIDAALETLASLSTRQAAIVEYRFFGGLEVRETAELLGVSEATVLRDWRVARAWLSRELGRAP